MAGRLDFEVNHDEATQTLVDRDAAAVTGSIDVGAMAQQAAMSSGIPIRKLAKWMRSLTGGNGAARGGVGQVNGVDFFRWRLYDQPKKERELFVSDERQWELEAACNDQELAERTVKKSECTAMLETAGVPTIPIEAIVDRNGTDDPDLRKIATGSELLELLTDVPTPVFAKPDQLLGSLGAFRLEDVDGDQILTSSDGWISADLVVDRLIGEQTYILQRVVENHDTIAQLSPSLATVRTINLIGDAEIATPFCVFKIPSAGNIADNFWRSGNLLANLDPATGEILRVVSGSGAEQTELHTPPRHRGRVGGPASALLGGPPRAERSLLPGLRQGSIPVPGSGDHQRRANRR